MLGTVLTLLPILDLCAYPGRGGEGNQIKDRLGKLRLLTRPSIYLLDTSEL